MNGDYGIDFFYNVYFYLYELIYIANVAENFVSITCNFANFFGLLFYCNHLHNRLSMQT